MPQQIQLRRGTAAQWTSSNPTLALGEPGVETDTGKVKYGDGTTAWTALAYASGGTGAVSSVAGQTGTVTGAQILADSTVAAALAAKAPLLESVNTVAASGSAVTIPAVTTATIHNITLTANCTFTFPTPVAGATFTLALTQGGAGGWTVTWPGTAQWPQGLAATLSTGVGKRDILTFTSFTGTGWTGSLDMLDVR